MLMVPLSISPLQLFRRSRLTCFIFLFARVPVHQKPVNLIQKARPISGKAHLTAQEKKEYRRKKLIKRSHTNTNMKALLHYTPSEDDIAHLLKEFTVDFLLKGYGRLVSQLYDLLVTDLHSQIDTSHFFWLVTYFLKFVVQLELDIDHVSSVISFDIISYLSFEGINLCEHLQIVKQHKGINLDPYVRRLHLVVTSIKEILHTIQVYYSAGKNPFLLNLQTKMCSCENLHCMMVLLIRQYDSSVQNIQYLQDLIVTNHMLLMLLETGSRDTNVKFDMVQHLQQFANKDVMYHYGVLLENFDNNGEFVNNSIFTMMHHVGGDLFQLSSLFQPNILKSFSKMWETDYDLKDDWSDLIEYTIHQYINIQKPQAALPQTASTSSKTHECSEWSVDDSNNLYWYYVQNAKSSDPVGAVIKLYIQNGVLNKTRQGVVQQLLIQDVISDGQYKKMMIVENMIEQQTSNSSGPDNSRAQNSSVSNSRKDLTNTENDETGVLRDHLIKEKKSGDLLWLQRNLLEACAAKLFIDQKIDCFIEPVAYHSVRMGQSISLVPFNLEQANAMLYQPFMLLLHKLGLHLPADAGKIYARIPSFLTADMLYAMADKLGPINPAFLKFEPSLVEPKSSTPGSLSSVDFANFGPGCSYRSETFKDRVNHSAEWIDIVAKTKIASTDDIADTISESTDSDLNRMYVSDEEFASKATPSLPKLIE
ncbi:hypothetical protein M8J77_018476 [Diaphorina citri]|nr:hypothetical protein M8J77_018476 [Diaphorina citri]